MPVRLKVAFNQVYAVSGMTFNWTTLIAKVQNLGFAKDVEVFFSRHGSASWHVADLIFQGHYGNYDVFGVNGVGPVSHVDQFAIRYRVNGTEFWDNNAGLDYFIGSTFSGACGGNVVLGHATARRQTEAGGGFTFDTGWVEGEILVNNLTFAKRVGVVMSRDNGATWEETLATYDGPVQAVASSVAGVERWRFSTSHTTIPTGQGNGTYRFAVFFEPLGWGQTFWDNNFAQDYFLSKVNGSEID